MVEIRKNRTDAECYADTRAEDRAAAYAEFRAVPRAVVCAEPFAEADAAQAGRPVYRW